LLERLEDLGRHAKPSVERAALDVRTGSPAELERLLRDDGPVAVYPHLQDGVRGLGVSRGGGQALFTPFEALPGPVAAWLADAGAPKWAHDAKELETGLLAEGGALAGLAFDTLLAGYLLDPAGA